MIRTPATAMAAAARARVPALGGERTVAAPDAIARDYLLLALRLDQHDPGIVDAYYGPADLKAEVDLAQRRPVARLRDDATALRDRLPALAEPDRQAWLDAQLTAIETRAAILAGESFAYLDEVERLYATRPAVRPSSRYDEAAAALDGLLPGAGRLDERLADVDAAMTIDPMGLPSIVEWLTDELRRLAGPRFGLPDGERVRVGLVTGQPWSGYAWYDGGLRSRIDLNIDLPIRAPDLLDTLAHETYAGHHLEHAWKETELVEAAGRLEHSVLLLLTPECLISEGLADLGPTLLLDDDARTGLIADTLAAAGHDPTEAGSQAGRAVAIRPHRRRLAETRVDAAIGRWADGWSTRDVVDYLVGVGRMAPERAQKSAAFVEHPRWRTYVHVYHEGEALLRRWVDAAPGADRDARFGRLLREPLTPGRLLDDLARGLGAGGQSSRTKATRSSRSSS
jgi:hypothetical protein